MPTPYHELISNANVPQSKQADPRQIPNAAGGYVFQVTDEEQLDRFLILGSTGGTYYIEERKLTKMNVDAIRRLIAADPSKVAARVFQVSNKNLAPSNDPAIFVLALMATMSREARAAALTVLNDVCRIPTHLFTFMTYYNGLGGKSNSSIRKAVARWYTSQNDVGLALHLTKYQQRDGMSNIDLINFSHPKPTSDAQKWLFSREITGKEESEVPASITEYITALRVVKATDVKPETKLFAIKGGKLPREVLPTEMLNKPEVWEALLQSMPPHAMIRNLAKMTQVGLLTTTSDATTQVLGKLADLNALKRGRVHPMFVYIALMTYASGHGFKGNMSWKPVDKIVQALNETIYRTFQIVEPTNRKILFAVDDSSSMSVSALPDISCSQVGAAMATIIGNTESNAEIIAFDTGWQPRSVRGRRIDDVARMFNMGGGTDIAQPIYAARGILEPMDQIVIFTDNETWAGRQHVHEAYREYKRSRNPNVSLVLISAAANMSTVGEPGDPSVLNVVGFDASVPSIIASWPKVG